MAKTDEEREVAKRQYDLERARLKKLKKQQVKREEDEVWFSLATQIYQRQQEVGVGNYVFAHSLGMEWDSLAAFYDGKSVPRGMKLLLMIKRLGGTFSISWEADPEFVDGRSRKAKEDRPRPLEG